ARLPASCRGGSRGRSEPPSLRVGCWFAATSAIKTICLILCSSTLCHQNSSEPSRRGPHKTSKGVLWYLAPKY
ncbi:hypothetical protein AMELA_G00125010, partial [Ameiurus melas]